MKIAGVDLGAYKAMETGEEKEPKEPSRGTLSTFIIYSVLAAIVFIARMFSWWAGIALFILFVLYVLNWLVASGFVFLIEIGVLFLVFRMVKKRGINLERVGELKPHSTGLTHINLVIILLDIYLILVTVSLGYFTIFGSSSTLLK